MSRALKHCVRGRSWTSSKQERPIVGSLGLRGVLGDRYDGGYDPTVNQVSAITARHTLQTGKGMGKGSASWIYAARGSYGSEARGHRHYATKGTESRTGLSDLVESDENVEVAPSYCSLGDIRSCLGERPLS